MRRAFRQDQPRWQLHVEPESMKIGIIGLGRMGGNIARRLMRGGHEVVVWDRNSDAVTDLAGEGAIGADSLVDMKSKLDAPAIYWVMLPAGAPTEETIEVLCGQQCAEGDIIIDGGNTFWKDDVRRAKSLAEKGVHYVDVGTSGGVWGLERGYCMMIGGDKETVDLLDPIFDTLAPGIGSVGRTPNRSEACDPRAEKGYIHAGRAGAGHFVKMVHNGIEYGLMQAYAEGFDVLWGRNVPHLPEDERFDFNLAEISEVWRRGSVISSWLLDLTASALAQVRQLEQFSGKVADSGEGRWTIEAAMEQATPVAVLTTALFARYRSRIDEMFGDKLLSAMRYGFGGHVEIPQ
ncbi:phosphogluconate dehydrogenase (NAD(+)-dependent, decarboxylating) [Sphingomonas sp. OV641]|uniref:phosphogluconate dehydrogenase (NAD(+)-dependent, decarboxylating) n=1 Tax=Sphingomonas sp. OV641 TaxID=1881068 RepID=UPI00210EC5C1|nr:decarboxylating 6-phosphogluconate dehydrogenase [Sphingomonas sp. OV641]